MFEIFDTEKVAKKMTDKVFRMLKVEEKFNEKEIRFFRWFGEKFPVKLANFIVAILTFIIFKMIYETFGIDYILMIGTLIMMFNLRELNKKMRKLTE